LQEEGVKIQLVPGLGGVGPRFQALLAGQLDIEGAFWVGWINVIARGGQIKAVDSTLAITKEMNGRSGILVLENSPIRSISDLRGKSIAVNILGMDADYSIQMMLQKNGVSYNQVQLLQVPMENEEQALRSKQVDAIAGTTNGGSWFDLALDRGGVRIIPGTSHYETNKGQVDTLAGDGFRVDFIKAHPDAVRHYVTAVEKAKRIIWESFQKDPGRVRQVYADIAREKGGNPLLGKFFQPISPDATVIQDRDIQFWIDVLVEKGLLKPGQIKPSDIYTNEFNPFAVRR
jgi:ABC-type nitrate/sulfonate/bicarbonate transport system substrate-binding protein